MSNVIQLNFSARQACLINRALKERAKNLGASDKQRRHALVAVSLPALADGRSVGCAVALGNSKMRPRHLVAVATPFGGDAA
ncbi:MAG TPA: hypothetical protein VIT90_15230 [Lysobacter sp.]